MAKPTSTAKTGGGEVAQPGIESASPNTSGLRLTDRWNDSLLDTMRLKGDPPADRVIQGLLRDREVGEARRLLRLLVENDQPPPEGLPPEVLEYLEATDNVDALQFETIEQGQELFAEHGPLILMCLGTYSLPAAYAAAKGVKVLHRTAYLEKRPAKRLFETTQMVIDVMTPGGLERGGRGVRAAQKVRLMHAMVRHLIQNDSEHPWSKDLGVPINQEDLAGTLMTFSFITLDGLHKLGIHPPAEAEEQYLAAWRAVGRLMGVEPVLLPDTVADAELLTRRIQGRQIHESEAGRLMTRALLEMMAHNFGPLFEPMPAAMMRHFLPGNVADFLGVPRFALQGLAAEVIAELASHTDKAIEESRVIERVARHFSTLMLQWMVNVELGGRSAPFEISEELRRRWRLDPETEPTFWQRLLQWFSRFTRGLFGR